MRNLSKKKKTVHLRVYNIQMLRNRVNDDILLKFRFLK